MTEEEIEELQGKLDVILKQGGAVGDAYRSYASKMAIRPEGIPEIMASKKLQAEFIVKFQWFQHIGLVDDIAAQVINIPETANFSKETSEDFFDGFMHFLVANEKRPEVLESFINKWVAGGRDLDEKDASGVTPAEVAVMVNNDVSFVGLYKHGLDVTAVGSNGYTPLHTLVIKVATGESEVSFLEKWIEAGLPTDMLSGAGAGDNSGKTPLEFAEIFQNEMLVNMLSTKKDNIQKASKNDDLWLGIETDKVISNYDQKMKNNPVIKSDETKLLLHYLVANADTISQKIIAKLFSDPMYFDDEINCRDGKNPLQRAARVAIRYEGEGDALYTPLHYAVHKGHNEFVLVMAKKGGFGVTETDNGLNILNYCVLENNTDLIKMLIADDEIDVTKLVIPERILDGASLPYTPLLQAVVEGKTDIVAELAKAGVGTTTLDNTNHVLNYVGNFGGNKTLNMLKALMNAKIHVSDEKAEQALVSSLVRPEINYDLVKGLVEMGVKTEGVLELLAANGLMQQVEIINKFVAEMEEASREVEVPEVFKDLVLQTPNLQKLANSVPGINDLPKPCSSPSSSKATSPRTTPRGAVKKESLSK